MYGAYDESTAHAPGFEHSALMMLILILASRRAQKLKI
jgi:hypothetical protein